MHLTLKREATKPAAANLFQQQTHFDDFVTRKVDLRRLLGQPVDERLAVLL